VANDVGNLVWDYEILAIRFESQQQALILQAPKGCFDLLGCMSLIALLRETSYSTFYNAMMVAREVQFPAKNSEDVLLMGVQGLIFIPCCLKYWFIYLVSRLRYCRFYVYLVFTISDDAFFEFH